MPLNSPAPGLHFITELIVTSKGLLQGGPFYSEIGTLNRNQINSAAFDRPELCRGARGRRPVTTLIRIIKHEAVPLCGSFEVRFPDDRPSRFVYWDRISWRRLRLDLVDRETALQAAQALARAEQDVLDSNHR
jgi:hypothetical protein